MDLKQYQQGLVYLIFFFFRSGTIRLRLPPPRPPLAAASLSVSSAPRLRGSDESPVSICSPLLFAGLLPLPVARRSPPSLCVVTRRRTTKIRWVFSLSLSRARRHRNPLLYPFLLSSISGIQSADHRRVLELAEGQIDFFSPLHAHVLHFIQILHLLMQLSCVFTPLAWNTPRGTAISLRIMAYGLLLCWFSSWIYVK